MKWFKQDTDASMDAKLQDVLLEYGAEGYGLYWYCLELIAGKVTSEKLTFELEHDARIIARNLGLGVQRVEEMMRHMISLGLFEESSGTITCLKLAKRADDFTRKALSTLAQNQVERNVGNDSDKVRQSPTKSDKVLLEDRSKKVEGRTEDRSKKSKRFAPPSRDELIKYIQEKSGIPDHPIVDVFLNHYGANGWKVGRNPMKCWKSAVNQWLAREGKKTYERTGQRNSQSGLEPTRKLTPREDMRRQIEASGSDTGATF